MSQLRASQRKRKPVVFFDESQDLNEAIPTKRYKPEASTADSTALEPKPVASIAPEIQTSLQHLLNDPIESYSPPIKIEYAQFTSRLPPGSPLELFSRFFDARCLKYITSQTNAYAQSYQYDSSQQYARNWHVVNENEILRYLGLRLYMGRHPEHERNYYWSPTSHDLGKYMGKTRWEQINRFFCLRDDLTYPRQSNEPWHYKLEPVSSWIRANCIAATVPSSWVSVDETMIKFAGRSKNTVKMKNKPIKQGVKTWVLAYSGYVYSWLYHTSKGGPESTIKRLKIECADHPIYLSPTHQVPYLLLQEIRTKNPHQNYLVFLDNLFLTVDIAVALLGLGVTVMGTSRKNVAGIPSVLLEVLGKKRAYEWNSTFARVTTGVLCFLWQDNNLVLGITTGFSLHRRTAGQDVVIRARKKPKKTSTNHEIVGPVFGDVFVKCLPIPAAIDAYNYHMNGVDLSNQLRGGFSCARDQEYKYWKPIAWWLIDVCTNNAYMIWRQSNPRPSRRGHSEFQNELIQALLSAGTDPLMDHKPIQLDRRTYCAWGRLRPTECLSRPGARTFGTPVTNQSRPSTRRGRQVKTGCSGCNEALCTRGACWHNWHSDLCANRTKLRG